MVYAAILASGVGKRMGADIPKQYLEIDGLPIIAYTLRSVLSVERIGKVYVAVSAEYIDYINRLVEKHFEGYSDKIEIVQGGKERIDTINNVTESIVGKYGVQEDDVVMFHDAVRPFVTAKILNDSIDGVLKYGAVVAGIPAVDTMLCSEDGKKVDRIPNRASIFHGQSPDSFNLKYFIELGSRLTDKQKQLLTGTSQFCTYNNEPIYLVEGDEINFKITTAEDLKRARLIVKERKSV